MGGGAATPAPSQMEPAPPASGPPEEAFNPDDTQGGPGPAQPPGDVGNESQHRPGAQSWGAPQCWLRPSEEAAPVAEHIGAKELLNFPFAEMNIMGKQEYEPRRSI